jgi:hypothetical protein
MAKASKKVKRVDSMPHAATGRPRPRAKLAKGVVQPGDVAKEISRRFRQLYLESGLTQREFADQLGLALPYVKGVVQLRFTPSPEVILKTGLLYGKDPNWFFGVRTV